MSQLLKELKIKTEASTSKPKIEAQSPSQSPNIATLNNQQSSDSESTTSSFDNQKSQPDNQIRKLKNQQPRFNQFKQWDSKPLPQNFKNQFIKINSQLVQISFMNGTLMD